MLISMNMDYQVAIKTPLGRMSTVIEITFNEDKTLVGEFEIMKLVSTFKGNCIDAGSIEFSGTINTPIGEIEYSANANINGNDFSGIAKTRVGDFEFMPLLRNRKRQ